ncbi:DUF924 domain-containing protein [Parvularcula sp. ZS-1/3]|uniref:DUF924 domain-containing protein n=1 Tax=Parvularcula mediterranea TaxID=2732508 RepID=A0A7Y3RM08_9PROT|nr:DUF924 domain-containing protein [Parvularcula mediterranea]
MTDTVPARAREVLRFWFTETPAKKRFSSSPEFDAEITERFKDLQVELSNFTKPEWIETPEALLAAVVVLDQFSRNIYRGSGEAFASDDKALLLAELGIACGHLDHWGSDRGNFLLMPLMHAEHLPTLERCCALFEQRYPEDEGSLTFARRHREPIARFGRYPSRNEAMGRETTPEEKAFLDEHPSGF